MTFQPIARSSLRDDIVASLRVAILNGTLAAGERVFETKIAEQMCVSRVPVREALTLLEQEGLIERLPDRGTFVTKLSNVQLSEFYTLRAAIEEFAMALAMECHTEEDIDRLNAQLDEMRIAVANGEKARVFEADIGFHQLIAEASHHALLVHFWKQIAGLLRAQYVTLLPVIYPMREDVVGRHQRLLDVMLGGDVEFARAAIRDHVVASGETLSAEGKGRGIFNV